MTTAETEEAPSTVQPIGETFKRRREEVKITLKEVENATSIRKSHLEAIEAGEIQNIISPVYAQGFIRQYASFLGLDGEAILREHPELFSRVQEAQEFAYGIGTLETRGTPGASAKWLPNLAWGVAFIGILILGWYFAKFLEVL